MTPRTATRWCAAVCAALLAGCGGGGGGGTSVPPPVTTPTPGPTVPTSLVIVIPTVFSSSHARTPRYVSPGTATVSIAVNGGTAQLFPVSMGTPCAPGTTTISGMCTVYTVNASVGNDTFVITLLDASNHVLSQGTAQQTIVANTTNTVNITFNGVVAALRVSLSNPSPPAGTAAKILVTLLPADAAGYTIVGSPGTLPNITVSDPDTSGATSLYLAGADGTCNTQAGTPAASVTTTQTGMTYVPVCLAYTGAAVGTVTISASITGGASGSAPFMPSSGQQTPSGVWAIGYIPPNGDVTLIRYTPTLTPSNPISGSQTNFGVAEPAAVAVDPAGNPQVLTMQANDGHTFAINVYPSNGSGNIAPSSSTSFVIPGESASNSALASDAAGSSLVVGWTQQRVSSPPAQPSSQPQSCFIYRIALSGGTATPSVAGDCSNLVPKLLRTAGLRIDAQLQHVYLSVETLPPTGPAWSLFRFVRNADGSLTPESGISLGATPSDFFDIYPNGDVLTSSSAGFRRFAASSFVTGQITTPSPIDSFTVPQPGIVAIDGLSNLYTAGSDIVEVVPAGSHNVANSTPFRANALSAATNAASGTGGASLTAQPQTVALPGPNTVTVSETGYTGQIDEHDNCTGIATVQPALSNGPSATFTLTGGPSGGTCTVTFGDSGHVHTATVQVGNTATVIKGQAVRRR
jgi:hypothetical protein